MNFFEEAEFGFRKAVEFGDTELDTWLFWVDILQFLGEFEVPFKPYCKQPNFIPKRTKSNTVWLESYDPRYHQS
jgi:hypothetical protein